MYANLVVEVDIEDDTDAASKLQSLMPDWPDDHLKVESEPVPEFVPTEISEAFDTFVRFETEITPPMPPEPKRYVRPTTDGFWSLEEKPTPKPMSKMERLAEACRLFKDADEKVIAAKYVRQFPDNEKEARMFEQQAKENRIQATKLMRGL